MKIKRMNINHIYINNNGAAKSENSRENRNKNNIDKVHGT